MAFDTIHQALISHSGAHRQSHLTVTLTSLLSSLHISDYKLQQSHGAAATGLVRSSVFFVFPFAISPCCKQECPGACFFITILSIRRVNHHIGRGRLQRKSSQTKVWPGQKAKLGSSRQGFTGFLVQRCVRDRPCSSPASRKLTCLLQLPCPPRLATYVSCASTLSSFPLLTDFDFSVSNRNVWITSAVVSPLDFDKSVL